MICLEKAGQLDAYSVLSRNPDANMAGVAFAIDRPTADRAVARILSSLGFSAKSSVVERFQDLPKKAQEEAYRQDGNEYNTKSLYHGAFVSCRGAKKPSGYSRHEPIWESRGASEAPHGMQRSPEGSHRGAR